MLQYGWTLKTFFRERSQVVYDKYSMIPFTWGTWNSQAHRDKKHSDGCQGLGSGNGRLWFNGSRASVWEDGRALELCLYNDCTTMLTYFLQRIVLLKMVKNQTCYVVHILLQFFLKRANVSQEAEWASVRFIPFTKRKITLKIVFAVP